MKRWIGKQRLTSILKTDAFDEAVGEGLYPLLKEYAADVHGIDVASESVNEAMRRHPGFNVRCADVRELSYADSSFDLVVSNSTLDHFQTADDIDKSLQQLFRVLKPGGELIISLDNPQNPIIGIRSVLPFSLWRKLRLVPYFVGKNLGRCGLVAALDRAGFKVLETSAIMHCPRFLAVALAGILQRRVSLEGQQRFLHLLDKFEALSVLPCRYFTRSFCSCTRA